MKNPKFWEYDPRTVLSLTVGDLRDFIKQILNEVEQEWQTKKRFKLYSTIELCELLNVNRQTLTKYRTEGLIGYSRQGDKFWYSQQDLDDFIKRSHNDPFS